MPRPCRRQNPGKPNATNTSIRLGKDQYIREQYAKLGPEEIYRRRLAWLAANGKWCQRHGPVSRYGFLSR